jgi:hypothetical protein
MHGNVTSTTSLKDLSNFKKSGPRSADGWGMGSDETARKNGTSGSIRIPQAWLFGPPLMIVLFFYFVFDANRSQALYFSFFISSFVSLDESTKRCRGSSLSSCYFDSQPITHTCGILKSNRRRGSHHFCESLSPLAVLTYFLLFLSFWSAQHPTCGIRTLGMLQHTTQ